MKKTSSRTLLLLSLIGAAIVAGATITQAVRKDSLTPLWTVGWLPAVIVGATYRRNADKNCTGRLSGRPR